MQNLMKGHLGKIPLLLSISVISLKKASLTINQVNFFISYLKIELDQLNLLESRANPGNRQSTARTGFQNPQGGGQFKPRYQAFNTVEQRNFNPQQRPNLSMPRSMGYPPQLSQNFRQGNQTFQQGNQNFQQGNSSYQQGNQQQGFQRRVQVQYFSCPLGCGHDVPWGSLTGCGNFLNMAPQLRKDTVDKVKASKCCLKTKGRAHNAENCKSVLCQCGRAPGHNELICPNQRVQMSNVQMYCQVIECDD